MKLKTILAVAFATCFSIAVAQPAIAQTAPTAKRIEVVAKKYSFEPAEITLKLGEPVDLVVKSMDVAHGIRFRELNVEVNARAGNTGQVQFTPQKAGDFVGHCSVFCGVGHGSMTLTLHVVE